MTSFDNLGDDSADLLFGLQLRCQKRGIDATRVHRNGLAAVARDLFKAKVISSSWKKRLVNLDTAYHIIRHLNRVGAEQFLIDFDTEISIHYPNTKDAQEIQADQTARGDDEETLTKVELFDLYAGERCECSTQTDPILSNPMDSVDDGTETSSGEETLEPMPDTDDEFESPSTFLPSTPLPVTVATRMTQRAEQHLRDSLTTPCSDEYALKFSLRYILNKMNNRIASLDEYALKFSSRTILNKMNNHMALDCVEVDQRSHDDNDNR
eukprot:TRINITY_DN4223_c0_g1_i1.p1 TRINITY_DN4223_c0_g1~~TRINITY_DN4223_c0_g1_i1.p1  ORF type:complete len:267 (+),score=31.28 TRINITY_DN4223_c0_g1_i1:53-853(+)